MAAKVALVVRPNGTIKRVMDLESGTNVRFEIIPDPNNEDEEDPLAHHEEDEFAEDEDETRGDGEIMGSCDVERYAVVERFGRTGHFKRAYCLQSTRDSGAHLFPQSVVWELDGTKAPSRDAFPMDFTASSGISIIEVMLKDEEHVLSDMWFTEERIAKAREKICADNGAETGYASNSELLHFLSEYTHSWLDKDAFVCPFNSSDTFEYEPGACEKDYIGIFVSTWECVDSRIMEETYHNKMQPSHFYIVVRSGATDEQSDQLRFTALWYASTGRTWADFAAGEEVDRARGIGRAKRVSFIERACKELGIVPRGEISHTDTNVFGTGDNGNPMFYAGASNSMEVGPGRAIFVNDGHNNPQVIWLHGTYNGRVGGGQWRADTIGHGYPECVASGNDDTLGSFIHSGFDMDSGFADLQCVKEIFKGNNIPFA